MEESLTKIAVQWWKSRAQKSPGGKIGKQAAAELSGELARLIGATTEEALERGKEADVFVGSESEPSSADGIVNPEPEITTAQASEAEDLKEDEPSTERKDEVQAETLTSILIANASMGKDGVEAIWRKKKMQFSRNTYYSIRSQLKKAGRLGPDASSPAPAAPAPKKRRGPGKKKAVGDTSAVSAASNPAQAAPAPPGKPTRTGPGTQLDRKIREVEEQIAVLTEKLAKMKEVRSYLNEDEQ